MNYISGYHAIEETIRQKKTRGTLLAAKENSRINHILELARERNIDISFVDEKELDAMCDPKRHKGLLLIVKTKIRTSDKEIKDYKAAIKEIEKPNPLILILDEITDPQNFGAVLRSADQFGIDLVITGQKRSARETDAVISASAGASAYVKKAIVANLVQVIEFLKSEGYWIYGADMTGEPADKQKLTGKICLVLGSEGDGIKRLVKEKCDILIKIPAKGNIDSFNVSVAAGILMYETRRQQGFKQ